MWRHGLLYKLYKLGINGKCWSIIDDCHTNTSSSVIVNQTQSRWFNVLQGVRQGGVLSSFLYLVFVNELIDELEQSSSCIKVLNVANNCPTLADDISLISLTPLALQNMLNIAHEYSKKWQFKFNADKSCVMQFRSKGRNQDFTWTLGDKLVPCKDSHTHLGITVNNNGSLSDHIKNTCRKGHNSFYAFTDIGSPYLNPLTLTKLYKSVVLPSVLYGFELWNNISAVDSQRLQVFQHSICKSTMNLPCQTRSDMCESLLDVYPISAEIDARKLLFFGRLCRMSSQSLPKQTFLLRLFSYLLELTNNQRGFMPDVLQLLTTYNLIDHLHQWIEDGFFPSKHSWKIIIRSTINKTHRDQRFLRMSSDSDFSRFLAIFNGRYPSLFWQIPKSCHEIRLCKFICKLITDSPRDYQDFCQCCGAKFK